MERRRIEMERWRSGVEIGRVVAPPCAAARLPSPSAVRAATSGGVGFLEETGGSLVRFVDARIVSQSVYSLI